MTETGRRGRRSGPTIADVARRAGVSTMTVSNVFNGRGQRVSKATQEHVLETASELGYRVNLAARHLRTGRTGTIGLAVPDFSPGYYSELAHRLAELFAERGLRLVLERTRGHRAEELASLSASRLTMYDGFVLSVVEGDAADLEQVGIDTPLVLIGERTVPDRFDHVLMDNIAGARLATEHLLAGGAERVALLGGVRGPADSMPELRTRGYLEAYVDAGLPVTDDLIRAGSFRRVDGYNHVMALIRDGVGFDAVCALTDSAAIGALRALAVAGLRVPDDVQVVGFDNLADGLFTTPTLTTVEPGNDAMAAAICEFLTARIEHDGEPVPAQVVMPPATLVVRGSTRRPA